MTIEGAIVGRFFLQNAYYARMWRSRVGVIGYSPEMQPITERLIAEHLSGERTLGVYQLKGDEISWVCVDFDSEGSPDEALYAATHATQRLQHLGMKAYLEDSGNKGAHVWLFFDLPCKAAFGREFGLRFAAYIEEDISPLVSVEVFPKQDRLYSKDDMGNLVKLPLGIHKKSGRRSVWIDLDTNDIQQEQYMANLESTPMEVWLEAMDNFPPVGVMDNNPTQGKACQLPTVIGSGERNKLLTSMAGTMRRRGATEEEILAALEAMNRRCSPPLESDELQTISRSVARYAPAVASTAAMVGDVVDSAYQAIGGKLYYVKEKPIYKRGTSEVSDVDRQEVLIANFVLEVSGQVLCQDGDKTECFLSLSGQTQDGRRFGFDMPATDATDPTKLHGMILSSAGGRAIVSAGQQRHLLPAAQSLAGTIPTEVMYSSLGWQEVEGGLIFVAPGGSIGVDITKFTAMPPELMHYGVRIEPAALPEACEGLHDLMQSFESKVTYPLVAHSFLAPVLRFLPSAKRYGLHLVGETGSLKTTLATTLLCLFGDFRREDPTCKWSSTANYLGTLGHYAKDVLVVLDDYKPRLTRLEHFAQLLHDYSDGSGKGRLARDTTMRSSRFLRGAWLSTGEDLPQGEASVLSRLLVIRMTRHEGLNEKLSKAASKAGSFPAAMGDFIRWVAHQDGLEARLELSVNRRRDELLGLFTGNRVPNSGRICTNIAQNWMAWGLFGDWFESVGGWTAAERFLADEEYYSNAMSLVGEQAERVVDEKVSTIFTSAIQAILASGTGTLTSRAEPKEAPPGVRLLGWEDEAGVYMQSGVSYHAVEMWLRQMGQSLSFTDRALWDQLEQDGLLIQRNKAIRVGGRVMKLFWFSKAILNEEEGDLF